MPLSVRGWDYIYIFLLKITFFTWLILLIAKFLYLKLVIKLKFVHQKDSINYTNFIPQYSQKVVNVPV